MTPNEIIEKALEYIKNSDVSGYMIEKLTGVSQSSISQWRNGNSKPRYGSAKKIVDFFEAQVAGDIAPDGLNFVAIQQPQHNDIKEEGNPYFEDDTLAAGYLGGESTGIIGYQPTGYITVPGVPTGCFFLKVHGESMINVKSPALSIPDGSWVALRKVKGEFIEWGEVYAIATTDGMLVKRLMRGTTEDTFKCVSYNEEEGYQPFEVPRTSVYSLAKVVAVVTIKQLI